MRITEKDARCVPPLRKWSLKWIPFSYRRDTVKAFLEAHGFQDVEFTDRESAKAGARWLFRAKRNDDLQVVLGDIEDDQGIFQVQAILEAKRRPSASSGTPLQPERRIRFGTAPVEEPHTSWEAGQRSSWADLSAMSDEEPGDPQLQDGDEQVSPLGQQPPAASRKRPGPDDNQTAPPEPKHSKTEVPPSRWNPSGTLVSNTAAGDCLFLSLAQALNCFGDTGSDGGPRSHRQLRAYTVAAINKNRASFEAMWASQGRPNDRGVLQNEDAAFQKYLDYQKVPGCWAGSIELQAFAEAHKVQVWVGAPGSEVWGFQ